MDMAFLRRAERILEEREALPLDHQLLLAALAAQQQAAMEAARSQAGAVRARAGLFDEDPLIELLLAGPRWREAATRQRGCFSRAEAGRRINGS
jgi:hypothetical protein